MKTHTIRLYGTAKNMIENTPFIIRDVFAHESCESLIKEYQALRLSPAPLLGVTAHVQELENRFTKTLMV